MEEPAAAKTERSSGQQCRWRSSCRSDVIYSLCKVKAIVPIQGYRGLNPKIMHSVFKMLMGIIASEIRDGFNKP
ncbi:hypothetical protein COCNU_contig68894266G000010 [Cocos nucifera]|nr:hypothetical protein [Cocos nucifera]